MRVEGVRLNARQMRLALEELESKSPAIAQVFRRAASQGTNSSARVNMRCTCQPRRG